MIEGPFKLSVYFSDRNFLKAIQSKNLQVKRNHEKHGVEEAGVDVTADILIVEGDVHPSTGTG